jgi:GNAT superfamily N-acetyltransferase
MTLKREIKNDSYGIKFAVEKDGKEVGWVYLYLITDHESGRLFGVMENLFVDEAYRRFGFGRELVKSVQDEARNRECFKLTFICKNKAVHDWYERMGFRQAGVGFEMTF